MKNKGSHPPFPWRGMQLRLGCETSSKTLRCERSQLADEIKEERFSFD